MRFVKLSRCPLRARWPCWSVSSPSVASATEYRLFYGTSSGDYSLSVDATNQTTITVSGLTDGARYYFAVKAYNSTTTSNPRDRQ
jgi:hypothetical protein